MTVSQTVSVYETFLSTLSRPHLLVMLSTQLNLSTSSHSSSPVATLLQMFSNFVTQLSLNSVSQMTLFTDSASDSSKIVTTQCDNFHFYFDFALIEIVEHPEQKLLKM